MSSELRSRNDTINDVVEDETISTPDQPSFNMVGLIQPCFASSTKRNKSNRQYLRIRD